VHTPIVGNTDHQVPTFLDATERNSKNFLISGRRNVAEFEKKLEGRA